MAPLAGIRHRTPSLTMPKPALILDFDGTITRADTLSTLAAALLAARRSPPPPSASPWPALTAAYLAARAAAPGSPPAQRTTLAAELAFQASLRPVELASVARVEASGVLAGPGDAALRALGRAAVADGRVCVRDGFGALVRAVTSGGWWVAVVSVNFSGAWIRGVVGSAIAEGTAVPRLCANRIVEAKLRGPLEGDGGLGAGERLLLTADDKAWAMARLLALGEAEAEAEGKRGDSGPGAGEGTEARGMCVYVGDSTTDLECLLTANKGIAMAQGEDQGGLMQTLRRIGLQVPHVSECEGQSRLAWARDFTEILQSGLLDRWRAEWTAR
ncbi:hypothetical protein P8C59_005667 [Phyllachora maydis]|uniref:Uncharacterized protein n=1 Tax=Phyllachora maydis TaxID=1825666 RepID=A0AAD9I6K7_9PEZI|nr:hypothetical protein P8C59_005667 [Phyllachora maydis]